MAVKMRLKRMGQKKAIQNMNLMFGLEEECGLKNLPISI